MWTVISKTPICMRVHGPVEGSVNEYLVAGLLDAAWRPYAPIFVTLWPAPDRASTLPRVTAAQVFGAGDVWAFQPPPGDHRDALAARNLGAAA